MALSMKSAAFMLETRLEDAARGDVDALYELGLAYSSGTGGVEIDMVAAHKWFNLAALHGDERGQACRHDIAEEMTAREIAEAQRMARAWLQTTIQRAA
ncbi:MAG: hypothetical protein KGQ42_09440 [Alphaproteobacteria bacterium]|nr:hypothetical protein [Alphaproteobacteria bacterium]MDE2041637.1 hypothetical protein [Alphaproteobacteria bacterium]MDE2341580.1 hypothetical protein [Alphaproteobacteria bacterium]